MARRLAVDPKALDLKMLEKGARDADLEMARRHFRDFLKLVRIEEPGTGPIPFIMWPHLRELTQDQALYRLIALVKSKQIGFSWWASSLAVWIGQFEPAGLMLLFSKGETQSHELIRKAKVVHRLQPEELQVPLSAANMESMTFETGGRILAYPSTMDAGIGENATCAVIDEAEFHPYFEQNLSNIKPTIDAGGQLIIGSTIDPFKLSTAFRRLYQAAPGNGYHKRFYGWRVRPNRDEAWYDKIMTETLDKATEQKNYPNNEEEALSPPRSLVAFDPDALLAMLQDVKAPIEARHNHTHVWQKWYAGKRYVAFTDTSHGVGQDDAVTVVMDVTTGYVVADVHSNVLDPEALAVASVELLAQYHNPVWGIETNDWGRETVKKAIALQYPRVYYRKEGMPGYLTNDGTRLTLWGDLLTAVAKRLITVPSREGLGQFFSVIRNPNKGGRIEAQEGAKDDYPFAVGGAWQLRHRAVVTHSGVDAPGLFRPPGRDEGVFLRWQGRAAPR